MKENIVFIIELALNVLELLFYLIVYSIKSRYNLHFFDQEEEIINQNPDPTPTAAQQEREKQKLGSSLTVFSEDSSAQSSTLSNDDKTKSNESLENNASTGQPPVACASEGRETATSKQEQEPSNNKESVIAVQPNSILKKKGIGIIEERSFAALEDNSNLAASSSAPSAVRFNDEIETRFFVPRADAPNLINNTDVEELLERLEARDALEKKYLEEREAIKQKAIKENEEEINKREEA